MYENHASIAPRINLAVNEAALEIIFATYKTLDVTNYVRRFLHDGQTIPQAFVLSNVFFGGVDPIHNSVKAFIQVCRITLPSDDYTGQSESFFQTKRLSEGQAVILNYDITLPRFNPPATSSKNIIILDASFYTSDVTTIVSRIAATQKEWPLVIRASNSRFGTDPAPNTVK